MRFGPATRCVACGRPLRIEELSGLAYCTNCDRILAYLPPGRTYMLLGPAGVGKSVFLYKLVDLYLRNNLPCAYVTFDERPARLRTTMSNFISEMSKQEKNGLLTFVDCYSCLSGEKSGEAYAVSSAGDTSELESLMSGVLVETRRLGPTRVVVDSATAMLANCPADESLKFLYRLSARITRDEGSLFLSVLQGGTSMETQRRLEQMADGLIEFKTTETQKRNKRFYRFAKVRGAPYFDTWLPFFIGRKGIYLRPPDTPAELDRFYRLLSLVGADPSSSISGAAEYSSPGERPSSVTVIEFHKPEAKSIFDFLVRAFGQDHFARIGGDQSGWRTLSQIARETKIPASTLYGTRGSYGAAVQEVLSRGLVESRIFSGERGRGGEIAKLKVANNKEYVKRYIENLS